MPIRVLIVDDSVVIRRLLAESLARDPEIEIAGKAPSGRIALAKIAQLAPDVVALDVAMPEMDGLQTLGAIRRTHPKLPVIMLCKHTEDGGSRALAAMAAGASDCVTKPDSALSTATAIQRLHEDILPRIKSLAAGRGSAATVAPRTGGPTAALRALSTRPAAASGAPVVTESARAPSPRVGDAPAAPRSVARLATLAAAPAGEPHGVLAIGVSTGGPNALASVLADLPASFPLPVVVVQHMPPTFTRLLAERLNVRVPMTVREARGGELLRPGEVWIAPGDHHMALERRGGGLEIVVHQEPHENSVRPAVDVLFRSVANACRERAIAVVLTGMGQDGLDGCRWIKDRNGRVLVQDRETSVVWGMPGFVARAGLADHVLPLGHIASQLLRMTDSGVGPRISRAVGEQR